MEKKLFLLVFLVLAFSCNLVSQPLSESLGGIKTNFQYFSDTVNLNVTDQILILRAEKRSHTNTVSGVGYGYGYQSFHLEFVSYMTLIKDYSQYNRSRILKLKFFDENKSELATRILPITDLDQVYNEDYDPRLMNHPIFYSIDLISVPIVLLDKTKIISITLHASGKN
jgi:hypothetical protein